MMHAPIPLSSALLLMFLAIGCTGGAERGSLQSAPATRTDSVPADSAVTAAPPTADTLRPAEAIPLDTARFTIRPDFEKFFTDQKAEGCFVLYDLNNDRFTQYNPERCAGRFIPASTFKIFNSLMALETGVLTDENMVIEWDGVKRGRGEWNQDQTMRTAFKYSAVWFYQEVARRIGEKRIKYYLEREGYGNRDIGGGVDKFWLEGNLRISPNEQVEFLRRLYQGQLGFSERSMEIVKDIMKLEETPAYTLRGKTGWALGDYGNLGWLVGYLERKGNVYFFATNLTAQGEDYPMVKARMEITKGIFKKLKLM